ncbi:MAG TPA: glycerol-3-phosphate 1-O-acyltransferase [Terriglobales bacterium]|nr:glycerol-3-phosphate 1-O-acyltransferase [Terriglobales bacterium]
MSSPSIAVAASVPPLSNGERRVIYLLDASSPFEARLLHEWIVANGGSDGSSPCDEIPIPPSRRSHGSRRLDPRLEACLTTGDDPLLTPLRVAWHPPQRDGTRQVRFRDLLTLGDPRDPGQWRQQWTYRRHPDRCSVVVGDPAHLSELRDRWRQAGGSDPSLTTGLADFVARQATLALERAERRLRGARYKVPRLVYEDILARPAFRGGIAGLARELGRPEVEVAGEAADYLGEIAATHSTLVIDLVANLIRYLYRRGYEAALHYDRESLEEVYTLAQRYPVVFLPTHKSNLDHLVLQYALHENGHPPNHTAGGINMNFFPVGPLVRRSGVFFIRRSFKDNPTYKFVLRQYIDYLIEKRFPLEWYIEGGRSRSGKLLPPRFGLLAYVVDAWRRGKSEDVYLVPVSIAYDQIADVGDYAAEQRGAPKQRESFGWFLKVLRALRRRYGRIHINFGEPLSLAENLKREGSAAESHEGGEDESSLALQKLAFEVSVRINRVTPITPTSLVTMALLGTLDRAMTVSEIGSALTNLVDYVGRRQLPTTEALDFGAAGIERVLEQLVDNGVVTVFTEGLEPVYRVGDDQHLAAAYYRNTIIHFFLNGAIAELALLHAADSGGGREAFWEDAMRSRDLLKFEFFFADKDTYRQELRREMALHASDWEARLEQGPDAIRALLREVRPFSSHRVLRPFLEAYQVVADVLCMESIEREVDEKVLLPKCLALGKQYRLQRRIRSTESVSKVLFETAFKLAKNRGLVAASPDVARRRKEFAEEIRDNIRRIDIIGTLAASRFAGLIQ